MFLEIDLRYLQEVCKVAEQNKGFNQPHPYYGSVLVNDQSKFSADYKASGALSAEQQVLLKAKDQGQNSTLYLNSEPGLCYGDDSPTKAIIQAKVKRVVIGHRSPLPYFRDKSIRYLREHNIQVDVLENYVNQNKLSGQDLYSSDDGQLDEFNESSYETFYECLRVNEALLHRAATGRPFSVLKFATTIDGKIATSSFSSAWVSSSKSRAQVFNMRSQSDAIVVGGNTVRHDNPRLTTRRESGHTPARVVLTRSLSLPIHLNLWDVSIAPTIVLTQKGASATMQLELAKRGVEVVEFDFLSPMNVANYLGERGFMQCLWECGGVLSAPAIQAGVIHKVVGFVAPKIIGGINAPSPCGELGHQMMTQALDMQEVKWQQIGPDVMMQGYLPGSGGLQKIQKSLDIPQILRNGTPTGVAPIHQSAFLNRYTTVNDEVIEFYKIWEKYGCFSNFARFPIILPKKTGPQGAINMLQNLTNNYELFKQQLYVSLEQDVQDQAQKCIDILRNNDKYSDRLQYQNGVASITDNWALYNTVEHYYQSQKYGGFSAKDEGLEVVKQIVSAQSPEEAAKIGRATQKQNPHLIRNDWEKVKRQIMLEANLVKFASYVNLRELLLSTIKKNQSDYYASILNQSKLDENLTKAVLVERSPHDFVWGKGHNLQGQNLLGEVIMEVRDIFYQANINSQLFQNVGR